MSFCYLILKPTHMYGMSFGCWILIIPLRLLPHFPFGSCNPQPTCAPPWQHGCPGSAGAVVPAVGRPSAGVASPKASSRKCVECYVRGQGGERSSREVFSDQVRAYAESSTIPPFFPYPFLCSGRHVCVLCVLVCLC